MELSLTIFVFLTQTCHFRNIFDFDSFISFVIICLDLWNGNRPLLLSLGLFSTFLRQTA